MNITKDGAEGQTKKAKVVFKYEFRNNQEPQRKSTVKEIAK